MKTKKPDLSQVFCDLTSIKELIRESTPYGDGSRIRSL